MKALHYRLILLLQVISTSLCIQINAQQLSVIISACNAARNCTECMAAHPTCNWCIAKPSEANKGWSSLYKRCDIYDNLISENCGADFITNITTKYLRRDEAPVKDATDSGPAIQVSPQTVNIKLRPNEKVKIPMTFRLAKDYPVDLYYLMDLSQSMLDDKKNVANLGISLADEMRKITKDVKLGFGSFVDKVLMPYVNTLEARLRSPCTNCESPYSFKHRLSLTEDTSVFGDEVNATKISGNLDEPEGGFDALMQAIVCNESIGWRPNSRKMLIFSTDAPFHSAGDGKLGGVIEPNDGLCHMTNNEYTWGNRQDYPSISQIASKVADNRINVIFAVTSKQTERYQMLSDIIPGSVFGELAGDSSNIVKLVKENYEKISSKVVMTVRRGEQRNEDLKIKLRADCDNTTNVSGEFSATASCDNLSPGGSVKFEVELQATSCANVKGGSFSEVLEVYPTGLTESLKITAEIDCSCTCEDTEPLSDSCNAVGTYECGICTCGSTSYGDTCQCDTSSIGVDTVEFYLPCTRPNSTQNQLACSGHGECVCGKCEVCDCLPGSLDKDNCRRFSGEFCQCNPDNCPRNSRGAICSGLERGRCHCDKVTAVHVCYCEVGYEGNECQCPVSQDQCIEDKSKPEVICNGRGLCKCGACECEKPIGTTGERYTGQFCEECSTCASKCQLYKECVLCYYHEQLEPNADTYDAQACQEKCSNDSTPQMSIVDAIPAEGDLKRCTVFTSTTDDCKIGYGYRHIPRIGYAVYIARDKDCPRKVNLIAVIAGVVGGIVFLGVVALLIWRLAATLHDRREFAKFEKESQQAQWNSTKNPIYVEATSTFKNPMYQGSMKKS